MDFQIQKRSKRRLRITCSNKVCSKHFEQENNVKFVESQMRRLKYGACQSLLSWSTRYRLREKPTVLHRQYCN